MRFSLVGQAEASLLQQPNFRCDVLIGKGVWASNLTVGRLPRRDTEANCSFPPTLHQPVAFAMLLRMGVRLAALPALKNRRCTALHKSHSMSQTCVAQHTTLNLQNCRMYCCSSQAYQA